MRKLFLQGRPGNIVPLVLIASAVLGAAGILGIVSLPLSEAPIADMRIEPNGGTAVAGEEFTIQIVVSSSVPVNVFAGELLFDPSVLQVQSIDYNTSIADLWAELPWFSNGDGTLNFAGGTTRPGGFFGTDVLITVTFKTLTTGVGAIGLKDARILKHDGLGTDLPIEAPIDALFTVTEKVERDTIVAKSDIGISYTIIKAAPSTDLNDDGKQSIADMSIFMLHLASGDKRSDFNLDGSVNTKDLSILMGAE